MNDQQLEQVLNKVDPGRRSMLKKLVLGAGFAVPVIASFSVKELSAAGVGSPGTTTLTETVPMDVVETVTTTTTDTFTFSSNTTVTVTDTTTITSTIAS